MHMQMSILNNVDYCLCIHRPTVTLVWHATSACNLHDGKGQLVPSLRSSSRLEAPVITATSTAWLLFIYCPESLALSITDKMYRIRSAVYENVRYSLAEGCTKKRLLPNTVNAACVCGRSCRSCTVTSVASVYSLFTTKTSRNPYY